MPRPSASIILGFTLAFSLVASCQTAGSSEEARVIKKNVPTVKATAKILPKSKQDAGPRALHSSIWTGKGLIIWGGMTPTTTSLETSNDAIYYPGSNRWFVLRKAELTGRYNHSSVWDGNQMIVWGGLDIASNPLGSGFRINPDVEGWSDVSDDNAPSPRSGHSAVWTGQKMMVWGGDGQTDAYFANGGIYDPSADAWSPLSEQDAPDGRSYHTANWTGKLMLVWGGVDGSGALNSGGAFDPAKGTWTHMSDANAPSGRVSHSAVWTGTSLIIWGGRGNDDSYLADGAIYDPTTDEWRAMAAPPESFAPRELHTAVWNGSEMIVYGGHNDTTTFADGAAYDPQLDSWRMLKIKGKLPPRYMHTAVWADDEMIVFGGRGEDHKFITTKIGARMSLTKPEGKNRPKKPNKGSN